MAKQNENPPRYDDLVPVESSSPAPVSDTKDSNIPHTVNPFSDSHAVIVNAQPGSFPPPMVYHYLNPTTNEHVASLLPPDHPEMVCLQAGEHVPMTRYGILGIMAAILWFPLGVGICLLDRRVKCSRCGHLIDEGVCG